MRLRIYALAAFAPVILAIVSLLLSSWGAAGPCLPEPDGC
jgi:hypothetical protein